MAGLYIHIPFCSKRCYYCDFFSSAAVSGVESFVDALKREIVQRRDYLPDSKLSTIYIGGGTPSTLSPETIGALLLLVSDNYDCSSVTEITMEANPDDLSADYLSRLAQTHVNRLSMGIQSFDDELLRFMNRRHDSREAISAFENARKVGFDNISIDLMYGILGLTNDKWEETVRQAIELNAEHISAYHLTIEPNTVFGKRMLKGDMQAVEEQTGLEQYRMLCESLCANGYEHYEISNFAHPERRSRHNSSYWSGEHYLGLGPAAHSFNGTTRRWNVASLTTYSNGMDDKTYYEEETLSFADRHNEYIMTRLRTSEGIDLDFFRTAFGARKLQTLQYNARNAIDRGILVVEEHRMRIPPQHFMMSDSVICELFEENDELDHQ